MKAKTLKKRLEKLDKFSKHDTCYKVVVDLIEGTNKSELFEGDIIRPIKRYYGDVIIDYSAMIGLIFCMLGIKYRIGVDSYDDDDITKNYIRVLTKIERD